MNNVAVYNPNLTRLGRVNQADGLVGTTADNHVIGTFGQRVVDTETERRSIVLKGGELCWVRQTAATYIGDNYTPGGTFVFQPWQYRDVPTGGEKLTTDGAAENNLTAEIRQGEVYEVRALVHFYAQAGDTISVNNFALYCGRSSGHWQDIQVDWYGIRDSGDSGFGYIAIDSAQQYRLGANGYTLEPPAMPATASVLVSVSAAVTRSDTKPTVVFRPMATSAPCEHRVACQYAWRRVA